MPKRLSPLYLPQKTAIKAGGTAATVGGAGVLVAAVLYLVRGNTAITLWPESQDGPIVLALTALLSACVRGVANWAKNRYV